MATSSYRARELEQLRQELRRELRMHDDAEEDAVMGTPPRAIARRPMSSSARVGRSSGFGDGARAAASARARAAASAREPRLDPPPSSRFGGGPVTPIAERARRPATSRAPSSVSRHRRGVHDRAPRAARTPARTPAPRATPRSPSVERLAGEYRSLGALAASVASTPRARPTTPSQRGPRYDLNGRRVDADADRGVSAPTRRRDPSPAIRSLREPSATPRARDDARGRWIRPSTAAVEYDLNGRRVVDKSGKSKSSAATSRDRIRNRPATAAAAVATTTARRPASSSARRTSAPVPLNERPAFDAGPGGLGVDNRDPDRNVLAGRRPATSTVSSPPVVDRDRVRARTSKPKSKVPVAARLKPSKTTADRDRGRRRADADRRSRERECEDDDDEDNRVAASTSEAAFAAARETRRARVRTPSTSGRLSGGLGGFARGGGYASGYPADRAAFGDSDAARPSAEFTAGYHRAHPPSAPASPTTNATARRPRTASAAFDPERAAERFLEEHHGVYGSGVGSGGGGGSDVGVGFDPRFASRPGTSTGADAVAAALSRAAALASAPSPSRLAATYGSYHHAEGYHRAGARYPHSAAASPASRDGYYPRSAAASPAQSGHARGYYPHASGAVAHAPAAAPRHDAPALGEFQHPHQHTQQQYAQQQYAQQQAHQYQYPSHAHQFSHQQQQYQYQYQYHHQHQYPYHQQHPQGGFVPPAVVASPGGYGGYGYPPATPASAGGGAAAAFHRWSASSGAAAAY